MPQHARCQACLEVDVTDCTVMILGRRPLWRPEYGPAWTRSLLARSRYTRCRNRWSLYWRDRDLSFHEYDPADLTPDIQGLPR
jgi:hypothetical protein